MQMSILVHPDKNPDDAERAQKAFEGWTISYLVICDLKRSVNTGRLFLYLKKSKNLLLLTPKTSEIIGPKFDHSFKLWLAPGLLAIGF